MRMPPVAFQSREGRLIDHLGQPTAELVGYLLHYPSWRLPDHRPLCSHTDYRANPDQMAAELCCFLRLAEPCPTGFRRGVKICSGAEYRLSILS
jgi:hypothetical protein